MIKVLNCIVNILAMFGVTIDIFLVWLALMMLLVEDYMREEKKKHLNARRVKSK